MVPKQVAPYTPTVAHVAAHKSAILGKPVGTPKELYDMPLTLDVVTEVQYATAAVTIAPVFCAQKIAGLGELKMAEHDDAGATPLLFMVAKGFT